MSEVSFNINDTIKVKLTDEGKEILAKQIAEGVKAARLDPDFVPSSYQEDEDGYIHPQLWDFMHIFGPHVFNGGPCYVENNEIIFEAIDVPKKCPNNDQSCPYMTRGSKCRYEQACPRHPGDK